MNDLWIGDASIKYPKELLDGRMSAEAAVIGLIWKDPLILDEIELKAQDFLSYDGQLYFNIAKRLREKKVNEFDEASMVSNLDENLYATYKERGGFKSISRVSSVISEKNRDSIIDTLEKYNIMLRLYDNGFNLTTPIMIGKKTVSPIEVFDKMSSTDIIEWYTVQLAKMVGGGYDTKVLEDTNMEITDEFLNSLEHGDEYGTPYGKAGVDVNGDEINVFPYLSSLTLGLKKQATHFIAGFSSSGKTCLWCSIVLSMALKEKVLIICNEQSSRVWRINMLSFILYKKFRYDKITKSVLMSGNFTPEQREMLNKAKDYFNETYVKTDRLHFIQLSENNIELVKAKIRYYHLQYGYSMVVYDTLKIADIGYRTNNTSGWEELIQYSRDLDIMAKRYDMIMCASVQLAQSQKGNLFLDSNMLSGAKGMVEQLDTLLCIRDVYKEELDKNSKYYCHPYQLHKVYDESLGKEVWREEPFEADPKYAWKMIFLCKARNAENSTSSGSVLMFNFFGQYAVFKEQCWARPKHGIIGSN